MGLLIKDRLGLREGAVVGLPRALLFYELYPFWRALLESLEFRLVVSGPTSREVIETGTREAADEACLPVKAFYGHVAALRGKVDAIFLPRLVSLKRGTYTCPKMLGLPDMVRHNLGRMPRVIVADFDETKRGRGLTETGLLVARRLGRSAAQARVAVGQALEALRAFRAGLWEGQPFEQAAGEGGARVCGPTGSPSSGPGTGGRGRVRVGLVGHAYNLFDSGVNLDLIRKLTGLGCRLISSERLSEVEVEAESSRLPKEIFWSAGRRILAAVTRFRREESVDGIIHLVSFGCGPDSMVGEIAERETRRTSSLPYLALIVDEHTAEAGLLTRLEAFVDMLERRRAVMGVHMASPGAMASEAAADRATPLGGVAEDTA
jgi:predicted nucleotide-binding protein (sugar kinase/HSP70/actin superfamily)